LLVELRDFKLRDFWAVSKLVVSFRLSSIAGERVECQGAAKALLRASDGEEGVNENHGHTA